MVKNVQNHIKGLNWGYKSDLIKMKAKYYNSYATFVDAHTLSLDNGKGKVEQVTADKSLLPSEEDHLIPEFQATKSSVSLVMTCSPFLKPQEKL